MSEELLREKKRFNVSFPIRMLSRLRRHSGGGKSKRSSKSTEESITRDISANGCYFLLNHEVPLGTSLDLEIEIPAVQSIPQRLKVFCRGKVVRIDDAPEPGKVGIACMIDEYRFAQARRVRTNARAA